MAAFVKLLVDGVYLRDRNSARHEPNCFAGIEIKPNESYVDALCRTIPARQRALCGLSMKMVSMRMREMNGEHINENEKINTTNEINRLRNMTDEEYDLKESRNNNANVDVKHNVDEDNNKIIESF